MKDARKMQMIFLILKAGCLAIYALALAGWAGLLPERLSGSMQNIALVMLAVHALETLLMFRNVRLYRGALAVSVVLAMLFGLLHWKPLADAQASAAQRQAGRGKA